MNTKISIFVISIMAIGLIGSSLTPAMAQSNTLQVNLVTENGKSVKNGDCRMIPVGPNSSPVIMDKNGSKFRTDVSNEDEVFVFCIDLDTEKTVFELVLIKESGKTVIKLVADQPLN